MTKPFTVVKEDTNEVLAIIDTEKGEIVEKNGVKVLTENWVKGYKEDEIKTIDLTDETFLRKKVHELSELSEIFYLTADEIIKRGDYYTNKGFKDRIAIRQDCFSVCHSLEAACSALLNVVNQSANIPSNLEKLKEK